uniref:Uncharacterized protein n=1 Tax=Psilocybe cubensis TaxID=181762 RepID=A0A8H8CH12_PSICU
MAPHNTIYSFHSIYTLPVFFEIRCHRGHPYISVSLTSNSFPVNRHSASAAPGLPRTSTLLIVLPIGFNIVVNTERRKLTDVDAKSSCTTSGSLAQMPFSLLLHTDRDKAPHLPSPISTDSRRAFTFCTLLAIIFNLIVDTHRHKTHQNGCRFIVHNLYISAHNRDPPRYLTPTAIRHSSYDTRNTWQHCAKHLQGASLHSAYQTLGLSTTNHESDKKLTEILNVRYRPGQQRTTHIDSSVSRLKLAVSMGVQQQPLI